MTRIPHHALTHALAGIGFFTLLGGRTGRIEDDSDGALTRLLGGSMQNAALLMVLYLAIAAAIVATLSALL